MFSFHSTRSVLHDLLVFGALILKPYFHLRLREAQFGCQVGSLGQSQVLRLLEALVEGLELQAGVDGAGFSDLLAFAVEPDLAVLDHRRGLLMLGLL